jgi:hypothetical protein
MSSFQDKLIEWNKLINEIKTYLHSSTIDPFHMIDFMKQYKMIVDQTKEELYKDETISNKEDEWNQIMIQMNMKMMFSMIDKKKIDHLDDFNEMDIPDID